MKSPLFCSILFIVTIGLHNAACKKSIDTPPVTYTKLKVLEYKTNFPIAGAEVKIYECTKQGFGGCADLSLRKTVTTDKDGNFQFDARLRAYVVEASESRYWDGSTGGEEFFSGSQLPIGDIQLTPIAYSKIHLKRINSHSLDLYLVIQIGGPFGVKGSYNLPLDTTVIMASYGNRNNPLLWYFTNATGTADTTNKGGSLPDYYINRFDTASVEINY